MSININAYHDVYIERRKIGRYILVHTFNTCAALLWVLRCIR